MKALILAAGRGKRINEISKFTNKCMTEIFEKPIIEHLFEKLYEIEEIEEFVVVVGYMAEEVMGHLGSKYRNRKINYVKQSKLNGIVSAIQCAKQVIGKDDFILQLGDEFMIYPQYKEMVRDFYEKEDFGLLGAIFVQDINWIKKTYTFKYGSGDRVYHLIEKPEEPFNNFMGTGSIILRNEIFDYIEETPINLKRGEKELVDLIQTAINSGRVIRFFKISDFFVNLNTHEDLKILKEHFPDSLG